MSENEKPIVIIESERGREAFLGFAQRQLPQGEALVKIRDLVGMHRSFETKLLDKDATLVAREPPLVFRGGLTAIVSYFRVAVSSLEARESHYEEGKLSHSYEVIMPVARLGAKAPKIAA